MHESKRSKSKINSHENIRIYHAIIPNSVGHVLSSKFIDFLDALSEPVTVITGFVLNTTA